MKWAFVKVFHFLCVECKMNDFYKVEEEIVIRKVKFRAYFRSPKRRSSCTRSIILR